MLGTYVLSAGYYDAYYRKAQQVRTLIKNDFLKAFESCDAFITPTSPTPAFALGEKVDDPLAMYLNDIYTVTANLAGVPGISVPCGLSSERLPIGFSCWAILVRTDALEVRTRLRAGTTVHRTPANQRFVTTDCTDLRSDLSGMRSPVKISTTSFRCSHTGVTSNPTWTAPGIRPFFLIS